MENIKEQLEEVIKKNLPEERNEYDFGIQDPAYAEQEGFNQALSQIDTSLIADEVLKVVVENLRRYIQKYLLEEHIHFEKEDTSDFIEEKPYIDSLEFEKWFLQLLSTLSPNKENENND